MRTSSNPEEEPVTMATLDAGAAWVVGREEAMVQVLGGRLRDKMVDEGYR